MLHGLNEGLSTELSNRWEKDWEAIKGEQWKNNAQQPIASVAGTTWVLTNHDGSSDLVFHFQEDGALHYKFSKSTNDFWKDGTWKQDGNALYMETNKKHAEFRARISGTRMEGNAFNDAGQKWTWIANPKEKQ